MIKHLNLSHYLWALLGISAITFLIILIAQPLPEYSLFNLAKVLPTVVTIDTIIIGLFSKYLWKWRIFKGWLVPFPNLNGTYKGTIQTTWIDPKTNERPSLIPAILTISQSFFSISCVMRTQEMTSSSFISDFILNEENQVKKLSYSYNSNPKQTVIERSPQHFGTIVFDIDETPKVKLSGQYWTGRKTTGNAELEFWKKEKLNAFPKKLGTHPVSEIRNNKS